MKRHRLFLGVFAQLMACVIALSSLIPPAAAAAAPASGGNRFNLVVVLDASGSMRTTDPQGYRFKAVTQFMNLLAEQGNMVGSVVFHTDVAAEYPLTRTAGQTEKDAAVQSLQSVPAGGWTNIGAGLDKAVAMLKADGDPNLNSVILLLSDGSSALGTDKETQDSLDVKAEAIQAAREDHISIYSVCLNADQTADIPEMQQISDATGGVFLEVSKAEDLQDVFNTFYELIYGATTIPLFDGTLPDSGRLETEFDVPGLGVEEVNIIVYGSTTKLSLTRPDGAEGNPSVSMFDTFSTLKLTDVVPGTWTLITEGVPGDNIKINMVYNTNLGVELSSQNGQVFNPADQVTFTATLTGGETPATDSQQYTGYSAQLVVMDAYEEEIDRIPMQVVDDHFEAVRSFEEGVYYCKAVVSGNHIDNKESQRLGPLTSDSKVTPNGGGSTPNLPENTAPVPVNEVVEATVNVWPFKGGSYMLDLTTLATDAEDDVLRYKIVSSSFTEGTDYTVDSDGVLRMDHFSLSKGGFTVQATDSGGLSCQIEVVVHAVSITLLTLIGLGAAALIAAIVCGILLYIALNKPFRGTITANSLCNGAYRGKTFRPRRGRCKLSVFGMDNVGLDYQKCYFQATGKNYIELVTNVPVICNGQESKKARITSGAEVSITIRREDPRRLFVRFDSSIPAGAARHGPRPGGKRAPTKPGGPRPGGPRPSGPRPAAKPGAKSGWR